MEPLNPKNARTRIQMEFIQTPHMKLTRPQVGRLCDLPQDVCALALDTLIASGFLAMTSDGSLVRGPFPSADDIARLTHELFVGDGRHIAKIPDYWRIAERELLERAATRVLQRHRWRGATAHAKTRARRKS